MGLIPVFATGKYTKGGLVLKQEKYTDIRPSEVAANKIHRHLEHQLATMPRTYKKTLIRYKDLAYLLIDCLDMILKYLTRELLSSSGDDEFNELTDTSNAIYADDDIVEIRRKLEESTNLLDTYDKLTNRNSIITKLPTSKDATDNDKINTSAMAKLYAEVLDSAAKVDYGYAEINECAKMINYWYNTRIAYMASHHKAYNIAQLPNWICHIILMYGKYHANGQPTFFINSLKQWCDNANEDFSNKYAIPKDITNLGKSSYMNDYTPDALVMYDILMEKGFLPLVTEDKTIVPMDPNYIVNLTKEHNPTLDKMIKTRFTKQAKYIKDIGLTPSSSDAKAEGVEA